VLPVNGSIHFSRKTRAQIGKDFVEHRFRATDDQVDSLDWNFVMNKK
jgi:hypothetical protein